MKNEQYNLLNQKIEALLESLNGGKGSGNFGHSGRPGKRGGSGSGLGEGHGKAEKKEKDAKEKVDSLEKALKELDKEGVPFTSPRYQGIYDLYKKAKADYLKKK